MIGVGLDSRLGLSFDQLRLAAREAERLGFESLWTPAGGVPDSFHVCAAWSQDTSLRTGISVVPAPRMWTPGLFAQMGFDAELTELERRRDRGAGMEELVAATPDEMLHAVGYYGPAATAPVAFARLSAGLDEGMVRIITARPGLQPVVETMEALTPALIRRGAQGL